MLSDTIYNLLISIVGSPSSDFESLSLYVLSCFVLIVSIKLMYDFVCYLFGIKR